MLFDRHGVAVATIMGTLLAGAFLLWLNYRAMGRPDLARRMIMYSLVAEVIVISIAIVLPPGSITQLIPLAIQVALAWYGTTWLQGAAIDWHRQRGAALQSVWRAAGLGFLAGMVILFIAVFILAALAAAGLITMPDVPAPAPAAAPPPDSVPID